MIGFTLTQVVLDYAIYIEPIGITGWIWSWF